MDKGDIGVQTNISVELNKRIKYMGKDGCKNKVFMYSSNLLPSYHIYQRICSKMKKNIIKVYTFWETL